MKLTYDQMITIDQFAEAVAASFNDSPRRWLCRFGGLRKNVYLPKCYRHLVDDYAEIKAEFMEQLELSDT